MKVNLQNLNSKKIINEYKKTLPILMQERADRYLSEEAALNFVVGRTLLKVGLEKIGLGNQFEKIQYSEKGKPFVEGIHFNISHTDGLVVCAFSDSEIGIDVEKNRAIKLKDFHSFFTRKEWVEINSSENPQEAFFQFWVKKESLIKVSGRTLKDLNRIDTSLISTRQVFDSQLFYHQKLDFEKEYFGAVCSPTPFEKIEISDYKLQ